MILKDLTESNHSTRSLSSSNSPSTSTIRLGMQLCTPATSFLCGEPARRHFWRFLAAALLVWLLLAMLVRSALDLAGVSRHRAHRGIATDWPEFARGEVGACVERTDWPASLSPLQVDFEAQDSLTQDIPAKEKMDAPPYHSQVSFTLPAGAEGLYLLSRGSLAHGSVRIEPATSDTASETDIATVDVRVGYWVPEALARASVCRLTRNASGADAHLQLDENRNHDAQEHGVGIFTPHNWRAGRALRPRDMLRFDVVLRLPAAPGRVYKKLETDFSNFRHGLAAGLAFGALDLKTSNAGIAAENVGVQAATLKTSNAPITGSYHTSSSLKLVTSNAIIGASVSMSHAGGGSASSRATELLLKTSNGAINTSVVLSAPQGTPGFAIQALTSSAPNTLLFPSHSPSAPLSLTLKTSNARAHAALHPAFEGTFSLRTSVVRAAPRVDYDGRVVDPSGRGREREVEVRRGGGARMDGSVWWGEWGERHGRGWAHLTTSNAEVRLGLGAEGGM
ncbi:hypothetical protein DFH11DRAFT_1854374 [Phellopilus nigrolimitatus]|nr:hypothetical protein DFH11DRAFT_1854374 [Phellopilus nigrolimitatus]